MSPPTRNRFLEAYDEWFSVGSYPDNYHWTNISVMSNVVGGLMSPPYEAFVNESTT